MSRINLEQLKTFLSVVRLGGVRKAADGLNLTQPAVTARIKNLEATLSTELFDRTSGGMRLTKRGELLLSYAEQFEHLSEMVVRDVIRPERARSRRRSCSRRRTGHLARVRVRDRVQIEGVSFDASR